MTRDRRGWFGERYRHSLAAKGIKTATGNHQKRSLAEGLQELISTYDKKMAEAKTDMHSDIIAVMPTEDEVWNKIIVTRGKRKGKLVSARKKEWTAAEYYVWRMLRFHTGEDVTMPVMAMAEVERYGEELLSKLGVIPKRPWLWEEGRTDWESQYETFAKKNNKAVSEYLDAMTNKIGYKHFGIESMRGTMRWKGLLF